LIAEFETQFEKEVDELPARTFELASRKPNPCPTTETTIDAVVTTVIDVLET
jgi:hypothetical protein